MSRLVSERRIQLEISEEKIANLIHQGAICASDIRCLNTDSRNTVRAACLKACTRNMGKT